MRLRHPRNPYKAKPSRIYAENVSRTGNHLKMKVTAGKELSLLTAFASFCDNFMENCFLLAASMVLHEETQRKILFTHASKHAPEASERGSSRILAISFIISAHPSASNFSLFACVNGASS